MTAYHLRGTLLNLLLLIAVFSALYTITAIFYSFHLATLLILAGLAYLGTALNRARLNVSPPRFPLIRQEPEKLGLPPFEEIEFHSRDGIELSGWYIPSENRAAVVLVHALGSTRVQMRHYAHALVDAGYGILLFDLRGHARSGGLSAHGWLEQDDLLGAVDFLAARAEIDKHRIGVIGFALGAQIAIRAAAVSEAIAAVWVDGPIPAVFRDYAIEDQPGLRQRFFTPWWWLVYKTVEWLIQRGQPPSLGDVIPGVSPRPVMVVAAGSERLIAAARKCYEAAREPKMFWQIDDIRFGTGILERGDDYDLKLIGFFNKRL